MTVPPRKPAGDRVSPAELLRAQMIQAEQRKIERAAVRKRARVWAAERAKHALPVTDPAYWYVMKRLRNDRLNGYKIGEPWCFEGRLKIHLTRWHEITNSEADCVVYYIRVGKYIKIGTTRNVDQRLKQYPPGSKLLVTEPGSYTREAERHEQFADYLAERNEWFRPAPELMAHIKNLQRHERDQLRAASARDAS